MPPTLILIRHAEALHNIDKAYHSHYDPPLSERGRQQALELREHLKAHLPRDRKVGLIVVSPLRRAIETCLIALDWLIADGVPIEPDARWQENYPKPCDTGSPPSVLAAQFPQVDFSHLDPVYPDKTSPAAALYHCNKDAVIARGEAALRGLYGREENVIVVVSHSGFMRTAVAGRWFANADWRGFDFVGDRGDEGGQGWGEKGNERPMRLRLVEWEMTKGKGGMGRSREERVGWGEGLPEVKELN